MNSRHRLHRILEAGEGRSGLIANRLLVLLILSNVGAVVLESVQDLERRYHEIFRVFETFSVAVFSLELLARTWACVENPRYAAGWGRLRYLASPMALVDLAAIAPFYMPWVGADLRLVRILRLFRLMRSLKLLRYSQALQTVHAVLRGKKEELAVTGFVGLTRKIHDV